MPGLTYHTHTRKYEANTNYWSHKPRSVRDVIDDAEADGTVDACPPIKEPQQPTLRVQLKEMALRQRLQDHLDGTSLESTVLEDGSMSYGLNPKYRRLNEWMSPVQIGDVPLINDWKSTLGSI